MLLGVAPACSGKWAELWCCAICQRSLSQQQSAVRHAAIGDFCHDRPSIHPTAGKPAQWRTPKLPVRADKGFVPHPVGKPVQLNPSVDDRKTNAAHVMTRHTQTRLGPRFHKYHYVHECQRDWTSSFGKPCWCVVVLPTSATWR